MAEEEKPIEEAPETTPEPAIPDSPVTEPPQEEPVSKAENESKSEEIVPDLKAEPTQDLNEVGQESPTAQTEGDEPLPEGVKEATPEGAGAKAPAPKEETPTPEEAKKTESEPTPERKTQKPTEESQANTSRNFVHLLLAKANATIQLRKQKKLLKIMTLFEKKQEITNDEVEKLLHVSDATATRYLDHLEYAITGPTCGGT